MTRYTTADGRLIGLFVPAGFDDSANYYPSDGRRAYLTEFDLPLQVIHVKGSPEVEGSKHVHRPVEASGGWPASHKVMVCVAGAVRVELSEADGTPVGTAELHAGDALLSTEGHEATYLQGGTRMLEIRQGPYSGNVETDRVLLD